MVVTAIPSVNEKSLYDQLHKELFEGQYPFYAGRLLARAAKRCSETTAIIYKDKKISYGLLYKQASSLSRLLIEKGLKPRDRVIICCENSPEFYIAYYAAWQAGAVVVPLNTFLQETELHHIINDCNPMLIIATSTNDAIMKLTQNESIPPIITESSFPAADEDEFDPIDLDQDELSVLLYTSGTTGFPKGVMLSSRAIVTNIIQGISRINLTTSERVFAILPLFHSFAQITCVWASFFLCCSVIVVPKIERRAILENIQHEPTIVLGVPALYGLFCLLKTLNFEKVKYCVSGGDALSSRIKTAFELIYRRKIALGYGLTETSPLVAAELQDCGFPLDCVGRPVIGVFCSIRDENGAELSAYTIGRLWVRGDNLMLGYYNAPEITSQVMKDGWFDTGDLAYYDKNNRLYITGRLKDLIIHKGFNIYPQEIENVITSHENVVRVGVIGLKHDEFGEVPIAYVQIRTESSTIVNDLKELCTKRLASYKVPRLFVCNIEELPLTATGKVDKKVLRKMAQSITI